ncbi:MAG: four helix bundle protein [Planctomycetota bacterium]
MGRYRELKVWQKGMDLTVAVYRFTANLPDDEKFGLVSQLRRAAVSIPSNIAEGHSRNTPGDMIRFASISLGSLAELETQLIIATRLGYAASDETEPLLSMAGEIGRMLHGLIRSNRS